MSPWDAIRAINRAPWSGSVKHLALALLEWRDGTTGELWPAVRTIARAMSVAESTVRLRLREAEACGALVLTGHRRGGRRPARYEMALPEPGPNPPESGGFNPPKSGAEPTESRRRTHRISTPNPPESGPDPSSIPPSNQPTTPAAVVVDSFSRLGIESLRGHANATPERIAWIAREAPSKANPSAWAAACIREAWEIPPPSEADVRAAARAERARLFAAFEALPDAERAEVLAEVERRLPNLAVNVARYRRG